MVRLDQNLHIVRRIARVQFGTLKHEIFRTQPLRQCAEVGGTALAIKDWRRQSAVSIRPMTGCIVECTMMSTPFANFST
jgi:hypothetical protein